MAGTAPSDLWTCNSDWNPSLRTAEAKRHVQNHTKRPGPEVSVSVRSNTATSYFNERQGGVALAGDGCGCVTTHRRPARRARQPGQIRIGPVESSSRQCRPAPIIQEQISGPSRSKDIWSSKQPRPREKSEVAVRNNEWCTVVNSVRACQVDLSDQSRIQGH
jgi:hypothetical protein